MICGYCGRDPATCARIPGRCCGSCDHKPEMPEFLSRAASFHPRSRRVCVGPKFAKGHRFGEEGPEVTSAVEEAVQAELARLPEPLATSPLAVLLLELARRLDGEPEDRSAAMLSREFRLVLAELYAHVGVAGGDDVERFLESIANPALRGPGD